MPSGVVKSVLAIGVAAGLGGCPTVAPYVCGDDDDCDRGGVRGMCLGDGACAYPDDDCDSGWARSPNSAAQAGECVPPEIAGTSSSGPAATSSSEASMSMSTTTAVDTSSETGPQPGCGQQLRLGIDVDFLSTTDVLEGYPLLVAIDDAEIVAAIGAADLVAITDDGTSLALDVERVDEGGLVAWIRLPAYPLGEPLPITLRFGPELVAGDEAATWTDRFVGVWHLDEAPSGVDGDEIRNSASQAEPAVTVGGMTADQSVAGAFGRGLQFDGNDDALEIEASFVGTLDSYALTMWLRYDDPEGDRGHYFYRLNGDDHYPRCWRFGEVQDGGDGVFCQYQLEGGDPLSLSLDSTQVAGQLVYLAIMRDAAAGVSRVWIDGELVGERIETPGSVLVSGDRAMLLGRGEDDFSLDGMIDEVRVSTAPIPETWVRADFRTQVDPTAAVQVVGELEPIPAGDCAG